MIGHEGKEGKQREEGQLRQTRKKTQNEDQSNYDRNYNQVPEQRERK